MWMILCLMVDVGRVEIGKHVTENFKKFSTSMDFNHFEVKSEVYITQKGEKSYSRKVVNDYCFDQKNNRVLLKEEFVPIGNFKSSFTKVTLFNEDYGSIVEKANNNSSWVMTKVAPTNDREKKMLYATSSIAKNLPWSCYMLGIGVDMLGTPRYEFTSYSESLEGSLLVVKADLKPQGGKKTSASSVKFWINPAVNWRLEKYEVARDWKSSDGKDASIAYGKKTYSPHNPLVVISEEVEFKNPKFDFSMFTDYKFAYLNLPEPKEYYLTHYNIPEPTNPVQESRLWYHVMGWVVGTGVVLFLIYFFLKGKNSEKVSA